MHKAARPWVAWIHQIHDGGGVGGSITIIMVMVFGRSLFFLCCF